MVTQEAVPYLYGLPDNETLSDVGGRQPIIDEMVAISPSDQTLDAFTDHRLRQLTQRLVVHSGEQAVSEYDRYTAVGERGLDVDEARLLEKHEGKTVLVTGGTGQIGSTLMRELSRYNPGRLVSLARGTTGLEKLLRGLII